MNLQEWRSKSGQTLKQLGWEIGFSGTNPARSVQLIERGERKADADTIERIVQVSGGEVTAQDMHETRLKWLKVNKPEQFESGVGA